MPPRRSLSSVVRLYRRELRPTTTPLERPGIVEGRGPLEEIEGCLCMESPPGAKKDDAAFSIDFAANIWGPDS